MMVVGSIAERDAVADAVLCVSNGDGTWTVYRPGDEIPAMYSWIFEA